MAEEGVDDGIEYTTEDDGGDREFMRQIWTTLSRVVVKRSCLRAI